MSVRVNHFPNLNFCAKIANLPEEKGYFCAKFDEMLKIGILSSQNPGNKQVTAINAIDIFNLTGYLNSQHTQKKNSSLKEFDSVEQLVTNNDCIFISNPQAEQFEIFIELLKKSKHLFFENPITFSTQQTSKLLETAAEAGVKIQMGHQIRHNPAYVSVKHLIQHPALINIQTLTSASGKNKSEVIDSLISDIVIALESSDSEIKNVYATGVNVTGNSPDFIQAKIEFMSGTVANLTGSRISTKETHQTEFFTQNSYIKVDFLKSKSEVLIGTNSNSRADTEEATTANSRVKEVIPKSENLLLKELRIFYDSIVNNMEPETSIYTSFKAVQIAGQILEKATR